MEVLAALDKQNLHIEYSIAGIIDGNDAGGIAGVLHLEKLQTAIRCLPVSGTWSSGGIAGSSGGIAVMGIKMAFEYPPLFKNCYSVSTVSGTSPKGNR